MPTRRLDRYLLAESLPPFLFSLLLFSSLTVLSGILPALRWVEGVPPLRLSSWLLWHYPTYLVQVLPIALLFTLLLVLGRLAADHEYAAALAGGVAPLRLAAPFVVLALLSAGAALWTSQAVLPHSSARITSLWWQLASGNSGLWRLAGKQIPVGRYTLSFERAGRESDELYGVRLVAWEGRQADIFLAERATYRGRNLELYGVRHQKLNLAAPLRTADGAQELLDALLPLTETAERHLLVLPRTLEALVTQYSGGSFEDGRSLSQLYRDATNPSADVPHRRDAALRLHRKLAEPLANVVLLLVAFPLSLLYARSRAVSFGLAVLVTLAWYLLLSFGLLLAQLGQVPVWLGAWGADLLLGGLGLLLLARLQRR